MMMAPNYAAWYERKLWTVEESICLMLGVEPTAVWGTETHDVGGLSPLFEAIAQYGELAADAMKSGLLQQVGGAEASSAPLQRRVVPRQFLEWAKTWNVAIPDELTPMLQRQPEHKVTPPSGVFEHLGRGFLQRGADAPEAREQVLGAAVAAIMSFPERCHDAAGIRKVIEDNASLIWSDTHSPPLPAGEIEALVRPWLGRLG